MSDVDTEIRTYVDTFVDQLSALVRKAALEAVRASLEGRPAPRKAAAPILPAKKGAPPARVAAKGARVKAPGRRKGEKRPPELLVRITDDLHEYIKSHPGQGVEDIAKGMGTATRELSLPIKKLVADKKISTKGVKRATKYFPR